MNTKGLLRLAFFVAAQPSFSAVNTNFAIRDRLRAKIPRNGHRKLDDPRDRLVFYAHFHLFGRFYATAFTSMRCRPAVLCWILWCNF